MKNLGIIVGNKVNDESCLSVCQWAGWNFSHNDC